MIQKSEFAAILKLSSVCLMDHFNRILVKHKFSIYSLYAATRRRGALTMGAIGSYFFFSRGLGGGVLSSRLVSLNPIRYTAPLGFLTASHH